MAGGAIHHREVKGRSKPVPRLEVADFGEVPFTAQRRREKERLAEAAGPSVGQPVPVGMTSRPSPAEEHLLQENAGPPGDLRGINIVRQRRGVTLSPWPARHRVGKQAATSQASSEQLGVIVNRGPLQSAMRGQYAGVGGHALVAVAAKRVTLAGQREEARRSPAYIEREPIADPQRPRRLTGSKKRQNTFDLPKCGWWTGLQVAGSFIVVLRNPYGYAVSEASVGPAIDIRQPAVFTGCSHTEDLENLLQAISAESRSGACVKLDIERPGGRRARNHGQCWITGREWIRDGFRRIGSGVIRSIRERFGSGRLARIGSVSSPSRYQTRR